MGLFDTTPEDQSQIQRDQLMAMAAAMFMPGGLSKNLGQGIIAAQIAGNNSRRNMQDQRMNAMQMQELQMKMAQQAQAQQQADALRGAQMKEPNFTSPQIPPGGPTPENADKLKSTPAPMPHEVLMQRANYYANLKGVPGAMDIADKLYKQAKDLTPELKDVKTMRGPDGNPVEILIFKDGTSKMAPYGTAEKLHFQNTGAEVQGLDPYTGQTRASLPVSQSPDSKATNALGWANYGLAKDKAAQEKGNIYTQPSEYSVDGRPSLVVQDKRTGALLDANTKQPVGNVQPKQSTAIETQLSDVRQAAESLKTLQKNFKPEYVGPVGEMGRVSDQYLSVIPGGQFGNPDRVKYQQVAATVVNNYIKAITGATVGQGGEQQRLMAAVPVKTDPPLVFKAKMDQMAKNMEELPSIIANNPNLSKAGNPGDGWSIKQVE